MCRETGVDSQEEQQLCRSAGVDASMQTPTGKGTIVGGGAGSPQQLQSRQDGRDVKSGKGSSVLSPKDGGIRPLAPRSKAFGQSPRLLPYFPKPGVTSPPPPLSLTRNADSTAPSRAGVSVQPTTTPPLKGAEAPTENSSPGASARASAKTNVSKLPSSPNMVNSSQASSPVSKMVAGRSSSAQTSRATARNPSPTPSTRTNSTGSSSSPLSSRTQHPVNASPSLGSRSAARNPSPTPNPRSAARGASPAARASTRNVSPAPASRVTPAVAGASALSSPVAKSSPLTANLAALSSNNSSRASALGSRRAASPVVPRKDPSKTALSSENGRVQLQHVTTPEAGRKTSALSASGASPDVQKPLSKSLSNRSLKESAGALSHTLENLMSHSPIKKLSALELQAQKRERIAGYGRKMGGSKSSRVACEGMLPSSPPVPTDTRKRCHWVTPQSEPDLVAYHDEVWGVPVHDDKRLFELLVLEGAQSELTRPQMLSMRDYFREVWGGFDPEFISKFDDKNVAALKADEIIRQPEAKLRGVIENAKQLLKIVEEFGSFDKYLWNFVGFKPIVNTPRIFNQIPVKSSKSEMLSKDLMRRGFRYVGPTTVYSFMQTAGMVNDHLVTCFRHGECGAVSQGQQPLEDSDRDVIATTTAAINEDDQCGSQHNRTNYENGDKDGSGIQETNE